MADRADRRAADCDIRIADQRQQIADRLRRDIGELCQRFQRRLPHDGLRIAEVVAPVRLGTTCDEGRAILGPNSDGLHGEDDEAHDWREKPHEREYRAVEP